MLDYGYNKYLKDTNSLFRIYSTQSKFLGDPIYKEIYTTNQLRKIVFLNGLIIPWNVLNIIISALDGYNNRATGRIYNGRNSYNSYGNYFIEHNILIKHLMKINIIDVVMKKHPYYKIPDKITYYIAGPNFIEFKNLIFTKINEAEIEYDNLAE